MTIDLDAKILVALDKSPQAETVFNRAVNLAKLQSAQLLIFHCLPLPHTDWDWGDRYRANLTEFLVLAQTQMDQRMEETRQWLSGYVHQAEGLGLTVDWDWRVGEPGHHICEVAKETGVDLIVLGRRGNQGWQEFFLGSVSNYVLHHAPCSVLIVQGKGKA